MSNVENCLKEALMPIVRGHILQESNVYTDGWSSYDGLITLGYEHYRIHHHENEFARGKNHVNGIESFWSYAKRRMSKFNGIHKTKLLLSLKGLDVKSFIRSTESIDMVVLHKLHTQTRITQILVQLRIGIIGK